MGDRREVSSPRGLPGNRWGYVSKHKTRAKWPAEPGRPAQLTQRSSLGRHGRKKQGKEDMRGHPRHSEHAERLVLSLRTILPQGAPPLRNQDLQPG